jgi:hypothetical protein
MGVWTLKVVSTKRNRGHIHTYTSSWGARKKEPVANESGAARDCGRNAGAGSLGIERGTTARRECQPGVPLAEALSRGAADEAINFYSGKLGFVVVEDVRMGPDRWVTIALPNSHDTVFALHAAKSDSDLALVGKQGGSFLFLA